MPKAYKVIEMKFAGADSANEMEKELNKWGKEGYRLRKCITQEKDFSYKVFLIMERDLEA